MKVWLQRWLYKFCVSCRPRRSRTVRFAFPLVLVSIALLSAAAPTFDTSSYVTLEADTLVIKEGDTVSIDVSVFAHEPVNAIDLSVYYPLSQLEIINIDAGQSVITLWTQDPYIENNTAHFQGGTYRKGFEGEHFIARIDAVAKRGGVADVVAQDVRLLAGDGSGTEVPVSSEAGNQTVQVRIANSDGELVGEVALLRIVTDIDGDGQVNLKDISSFMAAWNSRDVIYDFSGDGKMTFKDFAIILAHSFTN